MALIEKRLCYEKVNGIETSKGMTPNGTISN